MYKNEYSCSNVEKEKKKNSKEGLEIGRVGV